MKRLFEIQTLSDRNYKRLGDPVTIITGGLALLTSLFPSIFGGSRKTLTNEDWLKLLPGNGYLTSSLRSTLQSRIHYDVDVYKVDPNTGKTNMELVTIYHAQHTALDWCPDGSCQGNPESVLMPKYYALLRKESVSGGTSPIGTVPGFISGFGGLDLSTILLIGGGLFLLLTLTKKKSKR
jgi:hypothetical protein